MHWKTLFCQITPFTLPLETLTAHSSLAYSTYSVDTIQVSFIYMLLAIFENVLQLQTIHQIFWACYMQFCTHMNLL